MTTVDEARAAVKALRVDDGPFAQRVEAFEAAIRAESDAVIADYARRLKATDDARQTALDYIGQQQRAEAKLAALREAGEDLYRIARGEHGHDETHSADWPACLPAHMAFNRWRVLAATPAEEERT